MRHPLPAIAGDGRGASIVEFAIVLPVMLTLLMGLGELAFQAYIQSVLAGAVQKAGRDSAIEGNGARSTAIDNGVMAVMRGIAPRATYTSTRLNYSQFANVAPERFEDTPAPSSWHDGIYNNKECFTDVNGNKTWDRDPGITGQGGADDVTVYTFNFTYPRLFPLFGFLGWDPTKTITTSTYLRNQPYQIQSAFKATRVCPT